MTSTGSGPIPIPAEAPLHVNTLRILGLSKTRESFLQSVISDIFTATNTEQVLKSVKAAAGRLQRHDIFEEIKIYLNSPSNMDGTVDVTFDLKEKPRGFLSTTFSVGENEATLNGAVSMRNLFGGAETATATYQFGNRTKAAVEGSLAVPIKGSPDIRAEAFVNGCIKDYSMINHYQENVKTAGIRFKGVSAYGQHEVGYGLSQREITALPNSSATVRAHSGPNTKSSVFHTFVSDSRDSASMPTGGKYFGVSHEIAGIGQHGDASFVKQQIEAHIHQTVVKADNKGTPQIVLNAGAKAGFLLPLGEDKQVNVSDRFYVGGPLSVRGFKMGGIGPREGNDSLGGNLFYAAGVSLTSSIPGAPGLPIKAHAFFNAGSILQTKKDAAPNDVLGELINSSRTAAGFGLIFHHDVGRIEANFCIPLKFQTGDLPKPGLQFGLGINFL